MFAQVYAARAAPQSSREMLRLIIIGFICNTAHTSSIHLQLEHPLVTLLASVHRPLWHWTFDARQEHDGAKRNG